LNPRRYTAAMSMRMLIAYVVVTASAAAQTPRTPDLEAQRTAMKKIGFLVGRWSGEARLLRGPGKWVEVLQNERAEYRLDGLVLVIEGVGRSKTDNKPMLQALGFLSYDDASQTYRMRAFNDGRFLETEVTLLENGPGISWGFSFGQITTRSTLRIDCRGDWTEVAEIVNGSQPPQKLMELRVARER
jgi:hypothetical protein